MTRPGKQQRENRNKTINDARRISVNLLLYESRNQRHRCHSPDDIGLLNSDFAFSGSSKNLHTTFNNLLHNLLRPLRRDGMSPHQHHPLHIFHSHPDRPQFPFILSALAVSYTLPFAA